MIPNTAQDTILKFMGDGDTKQQAIERWEGIVRAKLPQTLYNIIPDQPYWLKKQSADKKSMEF